MIVQLSITVPPSINGLFGGGSGQRRFPSKAYKSWKKEVGKPDCAGLMIDSCKIEYKYFFKDNRARDCENFTKAISDWLVENKVIVDDSWQHVQEMLLLCGGIDRERPRVEVTVSSN